MKAKALTDLTIELPESNILVELSSGTILKVTGFVIRKDENDNPIIIFKAGKSSCKGKYVIYKDGEPCNHVGCLHHVTHPCEVCGRICGIGEVKFKIQKSIPNDVWIDVQYRCTIEEAKFVQKYWEKKLGDPWLIRVIDKHGVTVS